MDLGEKNVEFYIFKKLSKGEIKKKKSLWWKIIRKDYVVALFISFRPYQSYFILAVINKL